MTLTTTSSFQRAIGAAQATIRRACGQVVTYRRDSESVEVTAVPGSTSTESSDADGVTVTGEVRDFLFAIEDLYLAGRRIEPKRGDRITVPVGRMRRIYEVTSPGNAAHYRDSGTAGDTWRIHTRWIDTES